MFDLLLITCVSIFLLYMVPPEVMISILQQFDIQIPGVPQKTSNQNQQQKQNENLQTKTKATEQKKEKTLPKEKKEKSIFEKKLEEKKQVEPVKKKEELPPKIQEKLKINLEKKPSDNHIELRMTSTPRRTQSLISEISRSPRPVFKGRHKRKASSVSAELEDLKKDVDSVKLPDNPDKLEHKLQIEYFKKSIAEAEKNNKKNYNMNDIKKSSVVEEEVVVQREPITSTSSDSGGASGITANALLGALKNLRKTPK
eukprot:gene4047-7336_t